MARLTKLTKVVLTSTPKMIYTNGCPPGSANNFAQAGILAHVATCTSCTDVCYACPVNTYQLITTTLQASRCDPYTCPSGQRLATNTVWNTSSKPVCDVCDPGKWRVQKVSNNDSEPIELIPECDNNTCPLGKFLRSAFSSECGKCVNGQYNAITGSAYQADDGSTCTRCPAGYYGNETLPETNLRSTLAKSCIACPPGKYNENRGATDFDQCFDCPRGKYSNKSAADKFTRDCIDCSAGQHASSTGSTKCTSCKLGKTSEAPFDSCSTLCSPGKYGVLRDTGQIGCDLCPNGKFSSAQGASTVATCNSCPPGKSGESIPVVSSAHCVSCEAGSYQNRSAQTKCLVCPFGTSTSKAGQPVCIPCLPGTKLVSGKCEVCPVGTYSGVAASTCTSCEAGKYQPKSKSSSCIPCSSGTYGNKTSQSLSSSCTACGEGRYSSAQGAKAKTQCNACPPGKRGSKTIAQTSNAHCIDCLVGFFAVKEASTKCAVCPVGKATETPGQSRCDTCPPGTRRLNFSCLDCGPGTYSGGSATECKSCSAGWYGKEATLAVNAEPAIRRDECLACVPGQYSDIINAPNESVCQKCGPGRYGGGRGASSVDMCNRCPVGRYSPRSKLIKVTECDACPPGRYGLGEGKTTRDNACGKCKSGVNYQEQSAQASCTPFACSAGYFSRSSSSNSTINTAANESMEDASSSPSPACTACTKPECRRCAPGHHSYHGMDHCIPCNVGEIAPNEGSDQCTKCNITAGLTTTSMGATQCVCQESMYRANNIKGTCVKCRTIGVDCGKPGSTLETLKIEKGFWRADSGTAEMLRCPVPKTCLGSSNGSAGNGTSNSTCALGHHGPLCAICDAGYTRFGANSECGECPKDVALSIFWTIAASLLALGCLFVFLYFSRKSNDGGFRPLMNACQTLSVVLMTNSEWPEAVKFVQKYVLQAVNLEVISLASPACLGATMNFHHRFVATVIGSCILVGGPWLLSIRTFWRRKRDPESLQAWEGAKALRLHDCALLVLLIYTLVTAQAFYFFRCAGVISSHKTSTSTMTTPGRHETFYLISDYSVECYDSTWWGMFPLVLLVICVFSLGMPLGTAYCLWRQKDQLEEERVVKLFGMLYKPVRNWLY